MSQHLGNRTCGALPGSCSCCCVGCCILLFPPLAVYKCEGKCTYRFWICFALIFVGCYFGSIIYACITASSYLNGRLETDE